MMMQQKMTPHQFNVQMQMYRQQALYQEQLTNQQMIMSRMSPNIAPMNVTNINSMPPMNLSHPAMPQRGMDGCRMSMVQGAAGAAPLGNNDPYCCYFLEQLQGSYEVDGMEKHEFIVMLSNKDDQQFGIVQRASPNLDNVPDEYIYEENSRFTLCSQTGCVKAVMLKGMSMKHHVTWYANDGTQIVWRRKGKVSFNLVQSTPNMSRRNSIVSNCSGVSSMGTSVGSVEFSAQRIRPELQQFNTNNDVETMISSAVESTPSVDMSKSQVEEPLSEEDLLSIFQSHLTKYPSLLSRVVNWGISRIPNCRVGYREISELANGRLWITGSIMQSDKDVKKWNELLDELKGAYQEVTPGVFLQTPPQENEPGVQHRLRRSSLGLWEIEEYVVEQDNWVMCTQELPYGYWVDSKDSRKTYRIQIVPMVDILSRMKEQLTDVEETAKSMDFLFNSCNHKKLNTKLKARNLRHNIANLKVKLEKQHMLCFGVSVANIADDIALEAQSCEESTAAS